MAPDPRAVGFVTYEPSLQQVAQAASGKYYAATSCEPCSRIRRGQSCLTDRLIEITVGLGGVATLLVLLGIGAAVRWTTLPA